MPRAKKTEEPVVEKKKAPAKKKAPVKKVDAVKVEKPKAPAVAVEKPALELRSHDGGKVIAIHDKVINGKPYKELRVANGCEYLLPHEEYVSRVRKQPK